MSREQAYQNGYEYGKDGLTVLNYETIVTFILDHFGNEVANSFIEGYRESLNNTLHN